MHHEIYVDESSQNGHHFMVLGGIVIEQPNQAAILNAFSEARELHNLTKELKWGKISEYQLEAYKCFLDKFFEFMVTGHISFHCVVIDCHQLNHARYNRNNSDIGFSKFVYQLLMRIGRECNTYQSVHAYLDNRTTKQSLEELRTILNNGMATRHRITHRPFKRIQFLNSSESDFIQIVDLLIGAVAYQFNDHHTLAEASPARCAIVSHICSRTGLQRLNAGTPYHANQFTIWKMSLQPR